MKRILPLFGLLAASTSVLGQLPVSQVAENKNVVLEEFTGIYCTYCPDGHKLAQQLQDAHPDSVILVNIHAGTFADPSGSDPDFRTQYGAAIASQSGLTGYPAGTVNRRSFSGYEQGNAGTTAQSRADWGATAPVILGEASYVNVALEGSLDFDTRLLTVDVEMYFTGTTAPSNVSLNVALMQSGIEGPQTGSSANTAQVLPNGNYLHNHVLRHFLTGQWGQTISTTTQGTLVTEQYTYTLPADLNGVVYDLSNISVVAYVAEGQQNIITGAEGPIDLMLPSGAIVTDLAGVSDMSFPTTYCDGTVVPEVTINNAGSASITGYEISYTINGGAPVVQVVSSALNAGGFATHTFPSAVLPFGESIIEYYVAPQSGSSYIELVLSNNSYKTKAINVLDPVASAQSRTEGFESSALGAAAPAGAISDNPNEIGAFVINKNASSTVSHNIGGFGNSANSYFWNFYGISSGNSSIVFENLDLSSSTDHTLKFNHAYAQYSSENDKLEVKISTDCGVTWNTVFNKQGVALKTAPAHGSANFFPEVTEWVSNEIDISAYDGNNAVMVAFKGTSAYGNNLFVDDIQILNGVAASVTENNNNTVALYPNPSNGVTHLDLNLANDADVNVIVFNSIGEMVMTNQSQQLVSGSNNLSVDLSTLNNGIYFVHILIDGKATVKKVSLLK